ncbi:MAG: hypothetical protein GY701_26045 [Sulfitobacter sp.]|nr:hypothetical protein [Sulfitobacter sp.]
MASKYEALTDMLRSRSEPVVELTFRELGRLVVGLPASALKHAAWWSNTYESQPHSRYWLDAGRRAQPDFNGQRVRFETGAASTPKPRSTRPTKRGATHRVAPLVPTGDIEQATVCFEWLEAGHVTLDPSNKPAFPQLPAQPGIYRFRLTDPSAGLVGVYIGESESVSRRMRNYRNPGPTQPTNQRMHARIRDVLSSGGSTTLAVCLEAMIDDEALDLSTRPARLLAENTALVHAERRGEPVENL